MFKVFRRDCLYGLEFECNRFDFDYELLIKLVRKRIPADRDPGELPIALVPEGKKVSMCAIPLTWLRAC